jgi:hypothetical protein
MPNPQAGGSPFLAVLTAYTIYLWLSFISGGHLLHLQPKDMPCYGDSMAL